MGRSAARPAGATAARRRLGRLVAPPWVDAARLALARVASPRWSLPPAVRLARGAPPWRSPTAAPARGAGRETLARAAAPAAVGPRPVRPDGASLPPAPAPARRRRAPGRRHRRR